MEGITGIGKSIISFLKEVGARIVAKYSHDVDVVVMGSDSRGKNVDMASRDGVPIVYAKNLPLAMPREEKKRGYRYTGRIPHDTRDRAV